jgi:hypothetical protein
MYGRCHILLRRPEPIAHDLYRLPDSCRHLHDLILWCHEISLFMAMDETCLCPPFDLRQVSYILLWPSDVIAQASYARAVNSLERLVLRAVTGIARAKRGTEAQGSQRNRSVRTTYRSQCLNTVLYRSLCSQSQAGNVAFSSCTTMWSFWDGAAHYCAVSSKACAPQRARPPRL